MAECTLVTTFYPIPSKFPAQKYIQWAIYYLQLECPIVLYTSEELIPLFQRMRGSKPFHIIAKPFEELYMWKTYQQEWIRHKKLDHEPYHTPELYAIWSQKAIWMEEAIHKNPFQTPYFFWADIGTFRIPPPETIRTKFPLPRFPTGKILLSSVDSMTNEDFQPSADGLPGNFARINRIMGGLWGGDKDACLRWRQAYERMLQTYFLSDRFAGKDQSVMLSAYLQDPSLAEIVQPTTKDGGKWFFLHYLLSDNAIPYKVDTTFVRSQKSQKSQKSQSPENKRQKLVIVGPGSMPIPPLGWGAVESLIWDTTIFLKAYHPEIEVVIVNESDKHTRIQRINQEDPTIVHIQYDDHIDIVPHLTCTNIYHTQHYAYLDQYKTRKDHYFCTVFPKILQSKAKLLCLSPSIARVFQDCGIPKERIQILRNGANNEIFRFTKNPFFPDRSIYVGKIDHRKRQAVYQNLPMLYFAGQIADPQFSPNPRYLGEWNKAQLYETLTDYANLVLLSDGEAHPLVCCEALICGLGLVVSEYATAHLDLTQPFIDVIPKEKLNDLNYVEQIIVANQKKSVYLREEIREYGMREFGWKRVVDSYVTMLA